MSVTESIVSFASSLFRGLPASAPAQQVGTVNVSSQRDLYDVLRRAYYGDRDLYEWLAQQWNDPTLATVKNLRGLQRPIVEFYVALTLPGALPDALPMQFAPDNTKADKVRAAIWQVWAWSNWTQRKQLYIRQQAMLGNAFLYVASRPGPDGQRADRVYFHLIEPEHVVDLDTDERGFLTYIRTVVPTRDREQPERKPFVVIDEWWKARDLYRRWEVPVQALGSDRLPDPLKDDSMRNVYGIDFVPYVHAKHTDTGDDYGMAPIIPALEKQHELNRKETSFSAQLYRHGKPDMLLQGMGGQTAGQYAPPPPIARSSAGTYEVAGETFFTAPPGYTIGHLIANLPYDSHMKGVTEDIEHLSQTDLPELLFYMLSQSGNDTSGTALQTLLKPAIAKVEEARGNAEGALIRAQQMALTIGSITALPGFDVASIGTYAEGSFDHTFAERDVVPLSRKEEAEILTAKATAANTLAQTYDAAGAAAVAGFDAEEIKGLTDFSNTPAP